MTDINQTVYQLIFNGYGLHTDEDIERWLLDVDKVCPLGRGVRPSLVDELFRLIDEYESVLPTGSRHP